MTMWKMTTAAAAKKRSDVRTDKAADFEAFARFGRVQLVHSRPRRVQWTSRYAFFYDGRAGVEAFVIGDCESLHRPAFASWHTARTGSISACWRSCVALASSRLTLVLRFAARFFAAMNRCSCWLLRHRPGSFQVAPRGRVASHVPISEKEGRAKVGALSATRRSRPYRTSGSMTHQPVRLPASLGSAPTHRPAPRSGATKHSVRNEKRREPKPHLQVQQGGRRPFGLRTLVDSPASGAVMKADLNLAAFPS
jgi:hypothetical protein